MLKAICVSNWQLIFLKRGSAIARIVGKNVQKSNRFDPTVKMWVFEEIINGRKLSEIINQEHENVKYLPGYKMPKNVVSWEKKKALFLYIYIRKATLIHSGLPLNSLQYYKYEI